MSPVLTDRVIVKSKAYWNDINNYNTGQCHGCSILWGLAGNLDMFPFPRSCNHGTLSFQHKTKAGAYTVPLWWGHLILFGKYNAYFLRDCDGYHVLKFLDFSSAKENESTLYLQWVPGVGNTYLAYKTPWWGFLPLASHTVQFVFTQMRKQISS